MVQKTIIDTLQKEGNSQRVITERGGCSRGAVSKHSKCKVDWKLESTVKQSRFKHLGELHKEWTEAGVSASRVITLKTSSGKPSHFWNRNIVRSILPGLRRKRTGLLLSGPKSSFKMKVNFAFNLEIKVPESGGRVERHRILIAWSPVWSFHSQWWFGLPCHLLLLVHCVFQSQRSHLLGHFRALHASFCWQALWRCWFHFPAGLGTCPHCQRYQKLVQWPWCYCAWLASKLTWPEPQRESMGYCQEEDERHQTQQFRWPEGLYQRNLVFITPEQCHGLIASMPRHIDAVIHTKGGPTKYWVHRNEHTLQKPDISV